jgi:hypothetical protein
MLGLCAVIVLKAPESWTLLLHGLDVLVAREYPLANAIRDLD